MIQSEHVIKKKKKYHVDYLVCERLHTLTQVRGFQCTVGGCLTYRAAVEVWPLFPSLSGQIYSQCELPVSLLLSCTDEPGRSQTDAPGDSSVTGIGGGQGGEREREKQSDEISDS